MTEPPPQIFESAEDLGPNTPKPSSRIWPIVLLGLAFAVIFGLANSRLGSSERKRQALPQLEQAFKAAYTQEALSHFGGGASVDRLKVKQDKAFREAMEKVAKDAGDLPQNLDATRIKLAAQYELKQKPAADALKVLQSSSRPEDRNIARIYEADAVSRSQAQMWAPAGDKFVDRMIRAHAYQKAGDRTVRETVLTVAEFLPLVIFSILLMGGILLGIGCLIFLAIANKKANWPFPKLEFPQRDKADQYAVWGGIGLVMYVVAGILVAVLQGLAPGNSLVGIWMQPIWLAGMLAFMMMPFFGERCRWTDLIQPTKAGVKAGFGLVGFFSNLPLIVLAFVVSSAIAPYFPSPTHPIGEDIASGNPVVIASTFFMAAIMAPLVEETLFRGLILRSFLALFQKPWPAIVLQAFMFAAIHPQGPAGWLPLMVVGGMCGWLTYRSGSILPAMILHFVHNGFLVIMMTFLF